MTSYKIEHLSIQGPVELSESIDGIAIEYLAITSLSMLNSDLEVDGKYPHVVEAFRQKILTSDCYLLASPEYNYSITGLQRWCFHARILEFDHHMCSISSANFVTAAKGQNREVFEELIKVDRLFIIWLMLRGDTALHIATRKGCVQEHTSSRDALYT
ncbi:NADPH:quinone oxidoreductase [Tanacetum coccineum]|uniref:NAD(P)H dehydrogenase (quinone) n=1 Tax=Tanacetum coccineum TaxID=301880 RepID=A0ABQ5B5S7_9ASTR